MKQRARCFSTVLPRFTVAAITASATCGHPAQGKGAHTSRASGCCTRLIEVGGGHGPADGTPGAPQSTALRW